MTNRGIPIIIQGVILPVTQTITDGVATSGRVFHVVRAVLHKEIVTGATRSTAGVFKDTPVANWKDASGPIPQGRNTIVMPPQRHYSSLEWYWTLCPPN